MVRDALKVGDVVVVKNPIGIGVVHKGKYGTIVNLLAHFKLYNVVVDIGGEAHLFSFAAKELELISVDDDELYY